ncbi:MAG: cytochrome c oxidase subunit II [Chloroflexi bacterium]|nr:cytochrome c oxidase subunit II [Chloroflexota bacterium]
MSLRAAFVLLLVGSLALISTSVAFAQASGQPGGVTAEARDLHKLYLLVLTMALVVFVLVEGALAFMIFRYRRRDDTLPPQTHGNNLLEVVWTTIPIVIVLVLFVFSFITLVNVENDSKPQTLTVDVQGFQWQWAFTYNENDLGPGSDPNAKGTFTITGTAAKEPTLVIPVDEPVEFRLKSTDVIHAFYVPEFLYKLDVIPGRDNRFTVTPTKIGTYTGQCAELCGLNHTLMRFTLQVVSRADFDKFITDQLAAANKSAQRP